jgi:hypothetical protein
VKRFKKIEQEIGIDVSILLHKTNILYAESALVINNASHTAICSDHRNQYVANTRI